MATRTSALLLVAVFCAGCAGPGRLYTNIVEPYSTDFDATPAGSTQCRIVVHRVKEPVSGYELSCEWDTGTLADIARRAGIDRIHYIDLHTLSVFLGSYRRRSFIIYGD